MRSLIRDSTLKYALNLPQIDEGVKYIVPLQKTWATEGAAAFRFEVLEIVSDVSQLHIREQVHLDQHHPLVFNFSPAAQAPWLGRKRGRQSDEWRQRISAANIGRPKPPFTQAHRANLSAARLGKPNPHSADHRDKIIASNKRRIGERHTDDAKRKMSAALKGHPGPVISEAGRAHLSALGKVRTYSPETRAKMSESAKRRWVTPREAIL